MDEISPAKIKSFQEFHIEQITAYQTTTTLDNFSRHIHP
jgi:hypothetical protein